MRLEINSRHGAGQILQLKRVIWWSVAEDTLTDNPDKDIPMINKNISKMFKKFPPPPSTEELQGSGLKVSPASVRLSARAELPTLFKRAVSSTSSAREPSILIYRSRGTSDCIGRLCEEESP